MLGLADLTPATKPAIDLGHHGIGERAGQPAIPAPFPSATFNPPALPNFKTLPNASLLFGAIPGMSNMPNPTRAAGGGGIWTLLAQGFRQAGAGGLAQMAANQSPALAAWLRQESGLRPGAVSPANNHGLPNGGLFQFWEGHPWAVPFFQNGRFTMPVAQQARAAVRYFGLTPADVRRYAAEIRNHTYGGWG